MRSLCLDAALTSAMVALVLAPMVLTRSGFALDFTNLLWLTWAAGRALVDAGHPSYFLNAPGMGVFYPLLAFEGGTLLTLTGGIGELLGGDAQLAFVLVTALAVAGDYLGTLWLARQLGLRGLLTHAPAIAIVTSAYYITDLYGRGAWNEFVAVAALAPLAASGLYLVRARSWHPGAVLVFALSAIVFTGSHNITLLWGSTFGCLVLLVAWLSLGRPRHLPYRRLMMVAALAVVSALVNAWFLFADVAYARFVAAGAQPPSADALWSDTSFFNAPRVLLDPLRTVPSQSSSPGLYVQAPVWFLLWAALAGMLLLWRAPVGRSLRRAWLGALTLVVLTLGAIMLEAFWEVVPFPWSEIQFPYRLCSYVVYAVAGLVLVSALVLRGSEHAGSGSVALTLRGALVAACAISVGLCVWQQWIANDLFVGSYANRAEALTSPSVLPRTWYNGNESFSDRQAPVVSAPAGRLLLLPPSAVRGDRFAAWMNLPAGPQPIQTNIDAGPYLVRISGVQRVGRDKEGYAVVRRAGNGRGPVHVVVETAHSAIIEIGRLLSVLAVVALLVLLICTSAGRWARTARGRRLGAAVRRLRSPESGVVGQGARFALAGCSVSVVYLGATTLLAEVVGLAFQLALAIGFCCGLCLHFTLQRVFVWAHHEGFALPFHHQVGRYLAVAGTQYGLTALSTAVFAPALGVPSEIVYLPTVALLVSANFVVFRHGIFHASSG